MKVFSIAGQPGAFSPADTKKTAKLSQDEPQPALGRRDAVDRFWLAFRSYGTAPSRSNTMRPSSGLADPNFR